MKKVLLILGSITVTLINLKAQNYQTVYLNRIAYFINAAGDIRSIHADTSDLKSFIIPNRNIQDSGDCRTPYGPSWLGEVFIWSENENTFKNRNHELVTIRTDALLNESWKAYEAGSTIIMATVIDMGITPSYLGLRDWIKEIGFQAYDKNMIPKDHSVNDMTIILSENYGLFKTMNFYLFPDIEIGYPPYHLEEYDLVGLSDPKTGIQNLTWFEVFDFQPGDEIHIQSISNLIFCDQSQSKTIDKYLSRSDFADSIIYEIDREQLYEEFFPDKTVRYSHDTIRMVFNQNLLFDKLPGEPVEDGYWGYTYTMRKKDNHIFKLIDPEIGYLSVNNDSCWSFFPIDGTLCDCEYVKGLGGPFCFCTDYFMCGGSSSKTFVYYRKGDKTWGTPLIISAIPDKQINPGIEICPNPIREKMTIKINAHNLPVAFELIDISGKKVMQRLIKDETTLINLDENLEGIYLYRMTDNKGLVSYGKVVME